MIKKLVPCLKGYGKYAILTSVFVAIEVLLEIFIPYLMSQVIDVGIALADYEFIIRTGVMMILMALMSLLFGALSGMYAARGAAGFAAGIRKRLFDKIQEFSFANVDKFSTASLVTRLTTDITSVQQTFMMVTRMCVRAIFMLVSATIMSFRMSRDLSLVFLAIIPVLAVALYFISTRAYPRFREMFGKYDKMNRRVQENLIAMRVVKSFVRGEYENEKFADAAEDVRLTHMKAEKILIFNMPIMQFSMYFCIIAICWLGAGRIVGGTMETGALMGCISYVSQILMSLMMISMVFVGIVMSRASIGRIIEVFDEEIDIKDNANSEHTVKDGSVEFKNVSFSYSKDPGNKTLEDITFSIKSGETIGIIGGTGSAKTSLVQLIPRLYDILEGSVKVGGTDVREYRLDTLREAVAMVLQNNVLFSGTIRENLKWGNEDASDEQIISAAKAAMAHDFIESFPDGYETHLGQGGVNVSGGQKQRLCIARALLKSPKIIILDDSTSAVDTATDSKIRTMFKENLSHVTAIIIAQRISSVSDADRIIVLNDGKIDAIGTHEELLASNDIYQEVHNSQQRGVV